MKLINLQVHWVENLLDLNVMKGEINYRQQGCKIVPLVGVWMESCDLAVYWQQTSWRAGEEIPISPGDKDPAGGGGGWRVHVYGAWWNTPPHIKYGNWCLMMLVSMVFFLSTLCYFLLPTIIQSLCWNTFYNFIWHTEQNNIETISGCYISTCPIAWGK